MKCPFCKIELKEKKYKNIYGKEEKAFQCFQCGGIFFPQLGGVRISKEEAKKMEEINLPLLKKKFYLQERKNLKCPMCKKNLKKYLNPKYKNLLIFFCENCKGMFFNHGELVEFTKIKTRREEIAKLKEIQMLEKIYKTQGKEAALKAFPILFPDEKEIKLRVEREMQEEAGKYVLGLLQEYLFFLIPFMRLPSNIITNILLLLFPFLKEIIPKKE